MPPHARVVWGFLREHMNDPLLEQDRARSDGVVRARGSGNWAETVAGEMERHYSPGRTWEATARGIAGLLDLGDVLDLGAGDGTVAELLYPRARRIVCLDKSERMVEAGKARLASLPHVTFVQGDMHALAFPDASFDNVLLFNSLTYAERPSRVIGESARVLRLRGRVAIVTLRAHKHELARTEYNHVHLGFDPRVLRGWLSTAGFAVDLCKVTSRERREPHFDVLTVQATKKASRGRD
jgi:ArsR family transcriptional regulator